jgi:hypothetical protein
VTVIKEGSTLRLLEASGTILDGEVFNLSSLPSSAKV